MICYIKNNYYFPLIVTIFVFIITCFAEKSSNIENIKDLNINYTNLFVVKTETRDNDNFFLIESIVKFKTKNPIAKESKDLKVFTINGKYRLFILNGPIVIFLLLTDTNNNFLNIFSNKKEIQDWAKAISGIYDDNWLNKYALGATFKDLTIKGDKIYLLTHDGGSGATGGFNIEHVFTIKNGKPVTLVSRFIPNPEKEKRIKEDLEKEKKGKK